jgi:hypothetical protein
MNIRHAYSKEDPSPDERLLWGALVDDADALALLRIGYQEGRSHADKDADKAVQVAFEAGWSEAVYEYGLDEDAA